ncbi:MAG TPA: sigma-70 family RNA polymerase sigma factor [Bacillales bacterium]|nr:sigma-70 family RNA polymerase sigma factor [Bacillales bacterium]
MHEEDRLKGLILQSNKDKAIQLLIDECMEDVKRFVFTYVKNWSYTDDIVQDAFLAVYLNLDTFKESASIKTWILSIAANKAKDFLKSWHYKKVSLTNQFFHQANNETPETLLLNNQENDEVSALIFSLPVKYREVIILYYYKDLSIKEISEVLGTGQSTVKTRLHRAKMKIGEKLRGDFFEE